MRVTSGFEDAGIILGMGSTNKVDHDKISKFHESGTWNHNSPVQTMYNITWFLIGWVHSQNDLWDTIY